MPRIFDTPIWLILLAAIAFFMLGWVWYDMLFGAKWMALTGVTEDSAAATMGRAMAVGFLISLAQALGLAGLMKAVQGYSVGKGLKVGFLLWLLVALPVTAYAWNYEGSPAALLKIDALYLLVGYLLMGVIYGLLRKPQTLA